MLKNYLVNLLISLDEWVNTLFLGSPDETISSRAGKAQAEGKTWACVLCKFLDIFQKDHCELSIRPDDGSRAIVKD